MLRIKYLAFLLLYSYIAHGVLLPSKTSNDSARSTKSSSPIPLKSKLSSRDAPSRQVYLLFEYSDPTTTNATSPIHTNSLLGSLPAAISMTLQLEYANTPGAFPASIIQLAKTAHMYHDPVRNQMIIEQVFQAWLVQMTNPFPLAMSYLPNGQEVQIGNSYMTRFYLGTTSITDIDIVEPRTGAGLLLQVVRAIPKITPMPGQSRSAFMIAVMHALDIQGELMLGAIGAMNEMYRLADLNDLRGVVDYGQPMEYTFPDYRIPCLVLYQGPSTHRMLTGTAFSVLDLGDRSQPGRVQAMEALPDPRHFLDFLDRFLRDPWWDGISN